MTFLRPTSTIALLLAGCASAGQHVPVALPPSAEYAIKGGEVSRVDVSAAVLAARQSKYFPGIERYDVGSANQKQITILYYDMPGTCVFVERVHGRWTAIGGSFWMP